MATRRSGGGKGPPRGRSRRPTAAEIAEAKREEKNRKARLRYANRKRAAEQAEQEREQKRENERIRRKARRQELARQKAEEEEKAEAKRKKARARRAALREAARLLAQQEEEKARLLATEEEHRAQSCELKAEQKRLERKEKRQKAKEKADKAALKKEAEKLRSRRRRLEREGLAADQSTPEEEDLQRRKEELFRKNEELFEERKQEEKDAFSKQTKEFAETDAGTDLMNRVVYWMKESLRIIASKMQGKAIVHLYKESAVVSGALYLPVPMVDRLAWNLIISENFLEMSRSDFFDTTFFQASLQYQDDFGAGMSSPADRSRRGPTGALQQWQNSWWHIGGKLKNGMSRMADTVYDMIENIENKTGFYPIGLSIKTHWNPFGYRPER